MFLLLHVYLAKQLDITARLKFFLEYNTDRIRQKCLWKFDKVQ